MTIVIRAATAADAKAIGEMGWEFEEYLRKLGDEKAHSLTAEEYLREGFGENPAFAGLIAEHDGKPIGYLLYTPSFDLDRGGRFLSVVELFVMSTARRGGAGRALLEAGAAIARERGYSQMSWSVYAPNSGARAFYEQFGARYARDMHVMYLEV
jgi:GNAT superfamily N-acetyltransferase